MARSLVLMLLTATLAAAEAPSLDGVTWTRGRSPDFAKGPTAVVVATSDTPGIVEIAIALGALARKRGDLQVALISPQPKAEVGEWQESLGIEARYPIGSAPEGVVAAYREGARGLPHCVLVDRAGAVTWRGHPRALERVLDR